MPRKNYRQRQAEINEIGRLLAMGMTDSEIQKQLVVSKAQYYHYRRKLFDQSADLFKTEHLTDLGWHKQLLHDRLTKIYRNMELKIQLKKENGDPYIESRDYASTCLAAQNIAINVFKLESEGLRILNNIAESNSNSGSRYLANLEQPKVRVLSDGTTAIGDRGEGPESLQSSVVDEDKEPDESQIY